MCVCIHACKSEVITLVNVFQDGLLASPGVHMLWHCRSKRWKSVERHRDRWTQWHITVSVRKVGRADRPTPGSRSNAIRNWSGGRSVYVYVARSMKPSRSVRLHLLLVERRFSRFGPGLWEFELKFLYNIKNLWLECCNQNENISSGTIYSEFKKKNKTIWFNPSVESLCFPIMYRKWLQFT